MNNITLDDKPDLNKIATAVVASEGFTLVN